ncbi:MAG: trypsin-like peptidase domain-containing protein [Planctomycetota bacterium]|nr:trypsin-like peptidase domain-containing protein [Planctomycetota bacterium]
MRRSTPIGCPAWLIRGLACLLAAACSLHARAGEPGPDLASDPDIELASRLENAFQKVAQNVKPTVVSLTVITSRANWPEEIQRLHDHGGNWESRFTGSGVIISENGRILTNEHVIRGAERISVGLFDGSAFRAKLVATDPRSDLAVIEPLKPLERTLRAVRLADSDHVRVGQWALAVGNPFELTHTLTVGVVSARGRSLPARGMSQDVFYGNLIQTDAAINPGNSGGPLFNLKGELIGINTMIYSHKGVNEGFGFAIPANDIKPRLAYLEAGRAVEYGWLGVRLRDLEADQTAFQVPANRGVLVEEVIRDMPADRAGMQRGSVILAFESLPVSNADELILAVGMTPVGKLATLKLLNPKGEIQDLQVRVGLRSTELVQVSAQPDPRQPEELAPKGDELDWRGMRVRELTAEEAEKVGSRLRVIRVFKGTPADLAGLYEGAALDEVKYAEKAAIQPLRSLGDLRKAASAAKDAVYLHSPVIGYIRLDSETRE